MSGLIAVEIRRDLSRRLVRVLVVLAVVACAVMGVLVFVNAEPVDLVELWPEGGEDSILGVASFFLAMGGLIAGASMVGAEWRAGTMATLLTWEPRRVRVAVVKVLVAGALAFLIALVLQVVFVGALLPHLLAHGSTEGADGEWLRGLLGGWLRTGGFTALAAVTGASIAMIGRNTAAALGAMFAWFAVLEGLLRSWKPFLGRFLVGENSGIFMTGASLETADFTRSTLTAGLTLAAYAAVLLAVATMVFRRRDLASTT